MEKDYSCTYLKRLSNVRRYTSMEDSRSPRLSVSHDPIQVSAFVRAVAIGVAAVAQLAGQSAPANKTADRSTAYYHYTLGHMYAEQAGNKGDFLNRAIENLRLALEGRSRRDPSSVKNCRISTSNPAGCAKPCRTPKRPCARIHPT